VISIQPITVHNQTMEQIIYAIVQARREDGKLNEILSGMKGISDVRLNVVSYDEITAVVSDLNKNELVVGKSEALAFAGVIETLGGNFSLLPLRYGSMMKSSDDIKGMLERNHSEILQNLRKVEHRHEFGLKVICDPEKLKESLLSVSDAVHSFPENTESEVSVFRDYVNKKLKEHRQDELFLKHVDSVIDTISLHFFEMNMLMKIRKMVSPATIIDAVFLLDKGKKSELVEVIKGLQNKYTGMNFVLTGPWPPYNFVEIILK
jgi:hypothetical protein